MEDLDQPGESSRPMADLFDFNKAPGELIRDNLEKALLANHSPLQVKPNLSTETSTTASQVSFPTGEKKSVCMEDLDQPGESSRPMADLFDFNKAPGELIRDNLKRLHLQIIHLFK